MQALSKSGFEEEIHALPALTGYSNAAFFASIFLLALVIDPLSPANSGLLHPMNGEHLLLKMENDGSLSIDGSPVDEESLSETLHSFHEQTTARSVLIELSDSTSAQQLAKIRELIYSSGQFRVGILNTSSP